MKERHKEWKSFFEEEVKLYSNKIKDRKEKHLNPESFDFWCLGNAYVHLGNTENAILAYVQYLATSPHSEEYKNIAAENIRQLAQQIIKSPSIVKKIQKNTNLSSLQIKAILGAQLPENAA